MRSLLNDVVRARIVFFAVILCVAAGCSVPLNHIGAFAKASANLANTTVKSYEFINNSSIERRLSDIASEPGSYPDEETFNKVIGDSDLAVRINMLRGVESYAKALGDLASADFRKEIDQASTDLYGSLGRLQKTYSNATNKKLPLSDNDLAIIATAVDAIGTAIAENKRREALKEVVLKADPSIQMAMTHISAEIQAIKELSVSNMESIFIDKIKAYQHESKNLSYDLRVSRLNTIRKAYDQTKATPKLFVSLIASSKKIAAAHAVLRKTLEGGDFTSDELVGEIKDLAAFAKSTKDYHDKLTR